MTAREQVLAAFRALMDDDVDPPRDEVELGSIGIDSLGRWLLLVDIEERLGVTAAMDAEFRWTTVGDVIAWAELAANGRSA